MLRGRRLIPLRAKLQFGARGDISRKTRICPKEICALRAVHKFLTGVKTEIYAPVFMEIAMQFPIKCTLRVITGEKS